MSRAFDASEPDWPQVDFLLRLRADQAAGVVRPLREYLQAYPEHEAEIAAEYLQVRALDASAAQQRQTAVARHVGRFRLDRELGRGGEGTVFLAYEPMLGRQVALKLHQVAQWSELGEARLMRAVAAAARLDHPNVCRVLDAGREGSTLWVAMQFVAGQTLAEQLAARRLSGEPLSVREAARLLCGVAGGLQHAHQRGVLHRDVKPGNVIVRAPGDAVLTDFGLARGIAASDDLTLTGDLRGTPAYMAPEHLEGLTAGGGDADVRADLWALGVMLYECVTLQHPFAGVSQAAVARAIAARPLWSQPSWRRMPADLRAVLATALAVDPAQRYASAAALVDDLARLASGQPVAARAPGVLLRTYGWLRREPLVAASLVALALTLSAGLIAVTWSWRSEALAHRLASERASRTRQVAESILFDMDDVLVSGRGNVAMRQRLVVRARDALLALHAETPNDPQLRRELALAWMRAGDVAGHPSVGNRGDTVEAARCFAAAEGLARQSLADDPRAPLLLLSVLVKRADLARDRPDAARQLYGQVVAQADHTDPGQARLRAIALGQVAQIDRDAGDLAAAARGIAMAESALVAASAVPATAEQRFDLAMLRDARATILASQREVDAALALLDAELRELSEAPAQVDPGRAAQVSAVLRQHRGQCALLRADADAGLADLAAAAELWRARLRLDPGDGGAAARLRAVLEERGRACAAFGRADEAERDWRQALALAEQWHSDDAARLRSYLRGER